MVELVASGYDIRTVRDFAVPVEELIEVGYFKKVIEVDISRAFEVADRLDLYMSQAFWIQLLGHIEANLGDTDEKIIAAIYPKANLGKDIQGGPLFRRRLPQELKNSIGHDYIISPFARSLPPEQKWSQENWQKLVETFPEKSFAVFGNSLYDPHDYIKAPNVIDKYDKPFKEVCTELALSKEGIISVVTGTSHLAFHLGVKNILLNNQNFEWGTNPDAICIRTPIPTLIVDEVVEVMKANQDG